MCCSRSNDFLNYQVYVVSLRWPNIDHHKMLLVSYKQLPAKGHATFGFPLALRFIWVRNCFGVSQPFTWSIGIAFFYRYLHIDQRLYVVVHELFRHFIGLQAVGSLISWDKHIPWHLISSFTGSTLGYQGYKPSLRSRLTAW